MDAFWKSLVGRMADMDADQCRKLLLQVRTELVAEESVDAAIDAEIAELSAKLSAARFSDELKMINARLVALVAAHFKSRGSVSAVHEYSTACREQLLATALTLAVDSLSLEGLTVPAARYALLAFGNLGRREIRLSGAGPLVLVFEDGSSAGAEYSHRIALRLEAILIECSLSADTKANSGSRFWFGPVSRWLQEVGNGFAGADGSFATTFEMVADCRCLCGDKALAERALDTAGSLMHDKLGNDGFRQYAKSVANMPFALGIFGRLRTARTGKHRGEFSLEDLAITPLINAVRILAVHEGIIETATTARIWSLLKSGSLSVNLANRLLAAFHNFIRYQTELELQPDGNGKRFFNPDAFGDDARELFKDGLEDIGTLQRLVYQQIVEVV